MAAIGTGRSCTHCNRAKRKCDRVTPSCRFCTTRKLECIYPHERPSNFVPIQTLSSPSTSPELNLLNFELISNELSISEVQSVNELALDIAIPPESALSTSNCGDWFLAPETFVVDHMPMPLPPNFTLNDLNNFVRLIERWMAT